LPCRFAPSSKTRAGSIYILLKTPAVDVIAI
jgi:hypothetical protein